MRAPGVSLTLGRKDGWTLVEFMLMLTVIGVLIAIAVPVHDNYRERIKRASAVLDIGALQMIVKDYATDHGGTLPLTLAEVGNGGKPDPWGRPYQYLNLTTSHGLGGARKDRRLNPINSDFDLYSMGKDGASSTQLTNKASLDDIVRARDGAFIGLASEFSR